MKKILLLSFLFLSLSLASQEQKKSIDFDYDKLFYANTMVIDLNANGELEEDEIRGGGEDNIVTIVLQFRDYDSAGNLLKIEFQLNNEEKTTFHIKAEDVIFYKKIFEDGTSLYIVYNKLGEMIWSYSELEGLKLTIINNIGSIY